MRQTPIIDSDNIDVVTIS